MEQASIGLSRSLESALAEQGDRPVQAWEIVRSLLEHHREYGDHLGGKVVEMPGPEGGETREAGEWVAALRELFDPAQVELIDGRLAIWGLSLLDPALGDYLEGYDFLEPLRQEIRRDAGQEPQALMRPWVEDEQARAAGEGTKEGEWPQSGDLRQQGVLRSAGDVLEPSDAPFAGLQKESRQQRVVAPEEGEVVTGEEGVRLEGEGAPYLPPGPGYISDAVSDDDELVDHLGIEQEVATIAHVMTSKRVTPPLSLGLFGDWGSGKSFFMSMLRRQVAAIAAYYREREREEKKEHSEEWCTRVVQIDFNAWHYSDANLWASLVTRIYEALYAELKGEEPTDEKTRRLIREQVQQAEEEVEAAEAQVKAAKERVEAAETDLQAARQQRARQERTLSGLLEDVAALLQGSRGEEGADEEEDGRQALYDNLVSAAARLGYPEAAESYNALVGFSGDLRTFSRRLMTLFVSVTRSPWTLLVLVLALILYVLAEPIGTLLAGPLDEVQTRIVEAGAFLLPVIGWMSVAINRGLQAMSTIQSGLREVEAARLERIESSAEVKGVQQGVAEARAEEAAAESKLENARGDLKRLQSELDALQPERRLLHLLEERSQGGTYTRHLGIVSLIRNDFERLSQILKELNEEERDLEKEAPPIQRIVLYIDDLDRCRPEQVVEVLEAVHLLLAFPLFVVVVGVDPRWLRHSLHKQYPENLGEDGGGPGEEQATPQQYLEKIFQIPFALRPVDKEGFEEMVGTLLSPAPAAEGQRARGDGITEHGGEESVETPALATEGEDGGPATPDEPEPAAEAGGQEDGRQQGEAAAREGVAGERATDGDEEEHRVDRTDGIPTLDRPLNAEQLSFRSWEERDVKGLWTMFRTPRTVKRFVNTYRLLRAGLSSPKAVARFEGSETEPGSYQIAILLLAVVTSYPHLAGPFLLALDEWLDREEAEGTRGKDETEQSPTIYGWAEVVAALRGARKGDDWEHLLDSVEGIVRKGKWQRFTGETLRKWALRVSRYSFALHSSQAIYEQFGSYESGE